MLDFVFNGFFENILLNENCWGWRDGSGLKALAVLPKNPGSIPSTLIVAHNCSSSFAVSLSCREREEEGMKMQTCRQDTNALKITN